MEENMQKKLVCVIVGTNRSGKSSIFNMLCRSEQFQPNTEIIIPKNINLSGRELQSTGNSVFGLLPTEIINKVLYFLDKQSLLRCTSVCKSFSKLASTDALWSTHLNDWLASNTIATPKELISKTQSIKRLVKWLNVSEGGLYHGSAPELPSLQLIDTLTVTNAVSYTKYENFARIMMASYGVGILSVNPKVFKSMSIVDLIPKILMSLHAFAVTQDRTLIIAVNRLDEIAYAQASFNKCRSFLVSIMARQGVPIYHIVPVCAKTGENILTDFDRSRKMPWYTGPSIQQILADIYNNRLDSWNDKSLKAAIRTVKKTTGSSVITFSCLHSGCIRVGEEVLVGSQAVKVESIEQEGVILDNISAPDWAILTLKGNSTDMIREGDIISSIGDETGNVKKIRVILLTFHTVIASEKLTLITSSFAKRTVRVVSITKLDIYNASKCSAILEIEKEDGVPFVPEPLKKLGRFVLVSIVKNAKILNSPILMAVGIFDV